MSEERTIVQIIPADGWRALFGERTCTGGVRDWSKRLVCWALCEWVDADDGSRYRVIEGIVEDSPPIPADDFFHFVAYRHADDDEGLDFLIVSQTVEIREPLTQPEKWACNQKRRKTAS